MTIFDDRKLIERLDAFGKDLTPREVEFVASCLQRVREGRELTDAQRKWAEDLDDRKVGA